MHESVLLPCIFVCEDGIDEFGQYSICLVLWQLAREALSLGEAYFEVGHRSCLTACNHNRLKLLGYSHLLCCSLPKDTECLSALAPWVISNQVSLCKIELVLVSGL